MRTLINNINISQVAVVKLLLALLVVSIVSYLYFVNTTAFSAASYERIKDQITEVQSEIGELELAYIEKNNGVDRSMGSEFALVKVDEENITFTKRNVSTRLTFNER